jgi:hypothetical protein
MISPVWWSTEGGAHWRFLNEAGELVKAKWVRLGPGVTDMKDDGFRDLPGGPRGVLKAEIVAWEAHEPPQEVV